jgi:hypothetical protein|tara:strand:- start:202 stop:972 length:771 start_codon:yes stop_codon:yes gene_type:complete
MLTIEQPVFNANRWLSPRYLKSAALVSLLVHGLAILLITTKLGGLPEQFIPSTSTNSLSIKIRVPVPTVAPQDSAKERAKDQVAESAHKPATIEKEKPNPKAASASVKNTAPLPVLAVTSLKDLPNLRNYSIPAPCTAKELKINARQCDNSTDRWSSHSSHPYQSAIKSVFKHEPITISQQYKRDVARVETLLATHQSLEDQIGISGTDTKFFREEQQRITNEIRGIDGRYQEVNLLDVLSSSLKTIKKAAKAIKD